MTTIRRAAALLAALLISAATGSAMMVAPPTFPELVERAEAIVRATVTEVRAEEFDSPQGRGIRTLVTLRVDRTLKGATSGTVTLTLLGGTAGGRTLRIAGMPQFHVDDRQILFITGNGRVLCPLVGITHGRYHVRADPATGRDYVARDNGVPLTSEDEVVLPLAAGGVVMRMHSAAEALTPADFEARIAAVLSQQSTGALQPR